LINYLSGERALIIMTHGREPVHHLWPLNHVLPRVDISDPHTFLAIKRGILQYAWLKPTLSLAAIIMKATGTYQEGYIGLKSGYFWSGIIYNISVTMSLYSLGLFWVCMNEDLKPFRPMPKFLCVKLVIFASYWQGFFLSILVWLGALPDQVEGYTPDNLAAAIQDFLICVEMPAFAIAHWYAFSWHDFADNRIASARMPVWYAIRDAFGIRDLIQDSKETFMGDKYGYRIFDSGDKIMAHEASRSRLARIKEGMRYERGGKGKYWIPRPDEINQTTPLLGGNGGPSTRSGSLSPHTNSLEELILDPDEELLYENARKLEYGDWNVSDVSLLFSWSLSAKMPTSSTLSSQRASRLANDTCRHTPAITNTRRPAASTSAPWQAPSRHSTPMLLSKDERRRRRKVLKLALGTKRGRKRHKQMMPQAPAQATKQARTLSKLLTVQQSGHIQRSQRTTSRWTPIAVSTNLIRRRRRGNPGTVIRRPSMAIRQEKDPSSGGQRGRRPATRSTTRNHSTALMARMTFRTCGGGDPSPQPPIVFILLSSCRWMGLLPV
jgi:hypothetical protein